MNDFQRRQVALIALTIGALLVAMAASGLLRGIMWPIPWGRPFYLNPIYTLAIVFYGLIGLFTVFRADDHGWPWFAGAVGLWVLLVAFEDSILQWFVFQLGIATIGGRVNPVGITASAVAMGAAILLHVNQLGRQMRTGLAERGLDPRELRQVEEQSRRLGTQTLIGIVGLVAIGSVVLWLGGFALGRARVGIGALGILGGLLILSILVAVAYKALRTGPAGIEEEEIRNEAPRGRRPRGFR